MNTMTQVQRDIIGALRSLPAQQRLEIFWEFCRSCGVDLATMPRQTCHCANDE